MNLKEMGSELDSTGSGQGSLMVSCEHGNKPSGSIKGWSFLDYLTNYQLFKKISALGKEGVS